MKFAKLIVAGVVAFGFQNAYAFHSGGVAECSGCHSMHSARSQVTGYLLVGTDQSSTCLSCHEKAGDTAPNGYHISTADADLTTASPNPKQRTPGGDFSWVKRTFSWLAEDNTTTVNENDTHGHNIIAADYNYKADAKNTTAPGGTFPAGKLGCISCHDPHGKFRRDTTGAIKNSGLPIYASGSYPGAGNEPTTTEAVGVYRLLAGNGFANSLTDGASYPGVPAAKAPSSYNRTESATQTRVAYGVANTNGHATWGQWCGTCHPNMHSSTSGAYTHPVDANLGGVISGLYQSYVKSGDLTGVTASSFTSLVPFATNSASYADLGALALNTDGNLNGPGATDQVMCLSCHRAHASGFPEMLRWQMEYEFMTKGGNYIGSDNTLITGTRARLQTMGRTMADNQAAYYDRPATKFATYQRVLCNKCHAKD